MVTSLHSLLISSTHLGLSQHARPCTELWPGYTTSYPTVILQYHILHKKLLAHIVNNYTCNNTSIGVTYVAYNLSIKFTQLKKYNFCLKEENSPPMVPNFKLHIYYPYCNYNFEKLQFWNFFVFIILLYVHLKLNIHVISE